MDDVGEGRQTGSVDAAEAQARMVRLLIMVAAVGIVIGGCSVVDVVGDNRVAARADEVAAVVRADLEHIEFNELRNSVLVMLANGTGSTSFEDRFSPDARQHLRSSKTGMEESTAWFEVSELLSVRCVRAHVTAQDRTVDVFEPSDTQRCSGSA